MKLIINFSLVILCYVLISGCGTQALPSTFVLPTETSPPTFTPIPATKTQIPPTNTPKPTETPTIKPSPTPLLYPGASGYGYHHITYDIESDKIVFLPRQGNYLKFFGKETWTFDMKTNTWQMMSRGGPGLGYEGPMAYDIQSDRIITYFGFLGGADYSMKPVSQTWAYDTNTDTWTNLEPTESPYGLLGARMVYDSESDRMILVGGWDFMDSSVTQPETWAYDYDSNTWTNLQPTGELPPYGNYFAISYDSQADRVITWELPDVFSDFKLGVYDYNTNTWEQRETDTHPLSAIYNSMVYDPATGLNILFGGVNYEEVPSNETWGYDYSSNSWKRLPAKNPPSPRGWQAMTYHAGAGVIILFGGGASRDEFTNETWIYDTATNEWTNITINQ